MAQNKTDLPTPANDDQSLRDRHRDKADRLVAEADGVRRRSRLSAERAERVRTQGERVKAVVKAHGGIPSVH